MAKHKTGAKDDDKPDDGHPSNTTSGGKRPKATDEPADAKAGEGIAVYPPSPGDQAGEKTDNVPPAKKLPPDVPPEEQGADEATRLKAENDALRKVVAGLGLNPAKVAEQALADLPEAKGATKAGKTKTAFVTPAGGTEVEVEYPADAENPEQAAVEAWKRQAGIWSLPQQPGVRLDGGKKG